jgi:hypothetical protein
VSRQQRVPIAQIHLVDGSVTRGQRAAA